MLIRVEQTAIVLVVQAVCMCSPHPYFSHRPHAETLPPEEEEDTVVFKVEGVERGMLESK